MAVQQVLATSPSAFDCLQVRRLMEEDNRKARKAARKAYNEAGKCCTGCRVQQVVARPAIQPVEQHVQLPASRLQRLSQLAAAWRSPAVAIMLETHPAVRELAAFVRKRDKRMAAWQAELARQQQQREAQEKARCGCLIVESSPERLCVDQCAAFAGTYLLFGSHLQCRDLAGSALPQSALPACHTWLS